jgi:hypothetical protein
MKLSVVQTLLIPALLMSCAKTEKVYVYNGKETEQAHDANENYRPKDGYVDNPKMAAEIAELVAKRVYGKSHIEAQRPYIVTRNGDKWIVRGSFSEKPDMKGGVFEVRLSSSDGRVARLIHGK